MMAEFTDIVEIIVWINIFIILWIYLLYPMFISIMARFVNKPVEISKEYKPEITIIISAYNEEQLILGAIESIYNSEYPEEKIRVLAGSDGSTDGTVKVLNDLKMKYHSLEVFEFDRLGKNRVLNELVSKVKTDIHFYMDADLRICHGTLNKMISVLADENVGAVLASIKIIGDKADQTSGGIGESFYQKYETMLRRNESKIRSNINSLGTLYGIKKEVYNPIPNDLVCDDLYRMLQTAIQNKRIIFDDGSVVEEVREKSTGEEMSRRIRLAGGGLSTVWECRRILNPKYGWVSFFVWNHKVLRWFTPFYLMIVLIGTILLIGSTSPLLIPLIIIQGILYIGAITGWLFEKVGFN